MNKAIHLFRWHCHQRFRTDGAEPADFEKNQSHDLLRRGFNNRHKIILTKGVIERNQITSGIFDYFASSLISLL